MDREMLSKWLRTRPPFQKKPHPHDVAAADLLDQQAARIAELEVEVKRAEEEVEHFAKLAVVDGDLGRNPPEFWKDRAEKAEAERDAERERATQAERDWQDQENEIAHQRKRADAAWMAGRDAGAEEAQLRCWPSSFSQHDVTRAIAAAIRDLTPPEDTP